ncbi:hypothetical protein LPW36_02130 [Jinshanibacter sp. LJY008]|uniref:Uncharacterized protein n=1 Tax=Limnobaculum eriocheiris TaxID=2897391 RepID=A0A9X1MUN6_9GAMM|nr:hypothetical protein [Limnobaculum eriocheiris]MCD1124843.1 hypothetical protein [Limnobaculum eriocheiris]
MNSNVVDFCLKKEKSVQLVKKEFVVTRVVLEICDGEVISSTQIEKDVFIGTGEDLIKYVTDRERVDNSLVMRIFRNCMSRLDDDGEFDHLRW